MCSRFSYWSHQLINLKVFWNSSFSIFSLGFRNLIFVHCWLRQYHDKEVSVEGRFLFCDLPANRGCSTGHPLVSSLLFLKCLNSVRLYTVKYSKVVLRFIWSRAIAFFIYLIYLNLFVLKSEMRWKQYQSFAFLTIYWIFTHLNPAFALTNFVDNPSQKNSNGNQLIYRGNNKG